MSSAAPSAHLEPRFEDMTKQTHAARLGMWLFVGSEALLFSALFALYAAYRVAYPGEFRAGAARTSLALGTIMAAALLTSSYLVTLGMARVRASRTDSATAFLIGAIALGVTFLVLEGSEYAELFHEGFFPGVWYRSTELPGRGPNIFFTLFYTMTGLHALHLSGGVVLFTWLVWRVRRRTIDAAYHTPLELGGLYWHFVDTIWVFLWPVFYLMR